MPYTELTIDFAGLTEPQIRETLNKYNLGLTAEEILKIQNEILRRPPTLTECVLWSIQGSEHCSYKSSRPFFKQFVTDGPNVMLGPSEDAGIVELCRDNSGHRYGIVISHESHNHPSQVVPYEGAATGVGGNVRDVSCMGAKVIGNLDSLRFGALGSRSPLLAKEGRGEVGGGEGGVTRHDTNKTRALHDGVVAGIAGYGNPIGVPNLGGDVYYDESYNNNCLVNVVTLGIVRDDGIIHSRAPQNSTGYKLILVGKPTDNSGFGGASFASLSLKEKDKEKNRGAVQEPNAFLKRHLLKATYALFKILREKNLIEHVGFKDLGAGGIACASVELADNAGLGAEVNLDLVPRSMSDLHPSVILCSETQERYMWVAPPEAADMIVGHYNETFALPKVSAGARAAIIGEIRSDDQYLVTYAGGTIVAARASDVTRGLPYNRTYRKPERVFREPDPLCHSRLPAQAGESGNPVTNNIVDPRFHGDDTTNGVLLLILSHPNIASRSPIYEKYDKSVQGITVIERGEADAGVAAPFKNAECKTKNVKLDYPSEIQSVGLAIAVAHNPRYGKIDPYWGGVNAVVEAMRKVAAVGAVPSAITDCLNFGNPENPEQMWEFVEAVRGVADGCKGVHLKDSPLSSIPIISGNVSFYNETEGNAIAPSPIICCLGKLKDVNKTITMHFKRPDSILLMIGERKDECGGSVYYDLFGELGANVPKPDSSEVERQIFALTDAIQASLILSSHVIRDGGLAVALAEMSFKNEIGCAVTVPPLLGGEEGGAKAIFTETGGFVIEVASENMSLVKSMFAARNIEAVAIGKTTKEKRLKMNGIIDLDLLVAKERWENGLREKL